MIQMKTSPYIEDKWCLKMQRSFENGKSLTGHNKYLDMSQTDFTSIIINQDVDSPVQE